MTYPNIPNKTFGSRWLSRKCTDDKYVFKASVVCREFLAFKYLFIVFFFSKQIRWLFIIYICTSEILKTSNWNHFFGTIYPFVFMLVGREY